jgi:hypothetical protein
MAGASHAVSLGQRTGITREGEANKQPKVQQAGSQGASTTFYFFGVFSEIAGPLPDNDLRHDS